MDYRSTTSSQQNYTRQAMDTSVESRLLGSLALNEGEKVERVLISRLDSKEIQFTRNFIDPPQIAQLAFTLYTGALRLRNAETTTDRMENVGSPQPYGGRSVLLRLENSESSSYNALLSGKYDTDNRITPPKIEVVHFFGLEY